MENERKDRHAQPASVKYFFAGEYGICGDNAYWLYDRETATLNVFGSGDVSYRDWENTLNDKAVNVVIGDGITGICSGVFSAFAALETVVFSSELESISESAFADCTALAEIELTESVKAIGESAFKNCASLNSVSLSEELENIGTSAFADCTALSKIELPKSVKAIGESAFKNCASLNSVSLSEELENIGTSAFADCTALTGIELPKSVKTIGESTFKNCVSLKSVLLPEELESIGESAFADCTALTKIELPKTVRTIGASAFRGCISMTGAELKGERETQTIGANAFAGCTSLESFSALYSRLWEIGTSAFAGCTALKEISLPKTVAKIGGSAFEGCTALKEVELPGETKIQTIGAYAFAGCTSLEGFYAFYSRLEEISQSAFAGDTALMNIGLPRTLTVVRENAFSGCEALSSGVVNMLAEEWEKLTIEDGNDPLTDEGMIFQFQDPLDPTAGMLSLGQSYLLLNAGETAPRILAFLDGEPVDYVYWYAADENMVIDPAQPKSCGIISVSEDGAIQADSKPGTAYAIASLEKDPVKVNEAKTAFCRVDVMKQDAASQEKVTGVQLVTTAVTSKIYSETYARVSFLPLLQQNLNLLSGENSTENNGVAVENAEFVNANAAKYFDLRVADDRTLEIVPNNELITAALAGKKLPSSYTSKITFTIDGKELTTAASLKVTMSKAKPAVKAKAITLNKYAAVLGDPYAITFTGGIITGITNVTGKPAWLNVDTENRTLALSTETIPAKYTSGTVKLICTLEGWKAPVTVSQKYSVKSTEPSLKFGTKSVTLLQGSPDTVDVKLTVTPAAYADGERFPVTFAQLTKLVGKKYVPIDNETELYVTCENGSLKLRAPEKAEDEKAHTYKVTLSVAGKNFTYTVKTIAPVPAAFTVKAGGTINSRIANSPATLTVTPKNFHAGIGEEYTVEKIQQYKGKTLVSDDVKDLFEITCTGNVFAFTEKTLGTIVSGNTYKAVIAVDIDGDGAADGSTAASLKTAFPKTVPAISASVKSAGSLDITRPGNTMTLTGSVRNWFGDVTWSLRFIKKVGKKIVAITEQEEIDVLPFNIQQEGNVFTVTVKPGTAVTSAYSVKLVATVDGKDYLTASKTLSVKKGKATVKQSVKSGILYKKDRYSEIVIDLSIADTTVASIARVALDTNSSKKFDLTDLGDGRWALGYLNDTLPASFKASTAKLLVYLEGMPETVSAATVSLKVSYK